jgi:hypothetical protein
MGFEMSENYPDLEVTITELIPNLTVGGNECMCIEDDRRLLLYIDKNDWIKVGDVVRIERNEHGSYDKMWINGVLNTKFNPPKK